MADAGVLAVQCKMARAALGWGVRDLATAAQVSTQTVTRLSAVIGSKSRPLISSAARSKQLESSSFPKMAVALVFVSGSLRLANELWTGST